MPGAISAAAAIITMVMACAEAKQKKDICVKGEGGRQGGRF